MKNEDRYALFPVGSRVMFTAEKLGNVKRGALGTVTNHGPTYVHVTFSENGAITPCLATEISFVTETVEARKPDANRVYFHYNNKYRSGILNKIEVHDSTGNVLMYVREDGTGDLKAFDLSKIGFTGARFGVSTARQVLVEGMFTREW